jgi:hypothetical protein
MKLNPFSVLRFLLFLILLLTSSAQAQDSLASPQSRKYTSIGFQASFVSGIGISIGYNEDGKYRFRATGGILADNQISYYSLGVEYGFELTKNKQYRVFIGPAFGIRGESDSDNHTMLGLGTGFESSTTGTIIFENISVGAEVYYPTYNFLSQSVWFAGGVFIAYNF